jgi:hypothetical protein
MMIPGFVGGRMVGQQTGDQSQLFYLFNLERRIPEPIFRAASIRLRSRFAAAVQ